MTHLGEALLIDNFGCAAVEKEEKYSIQSSKAVDDEPDVHRDRFTLRYLVKTFSFFLKLSTNVSLLAN